MTGHRLGNLLQSPVSGNMLQHWCHCSSGSWVMTLGSWHQNHDVRIITIWLFSSLNVGHMFSGTKQLVDAWGQLHLDGRFGPTSWFARIPYLSFKNDVLLDLHLRYRCQMDAQGHPHNLPPTPTFCTSPHTLNPSLRSDVSVCYLAYIWFI